MVQPESTYKEVCTEVYTHIDSVLIVFCLQSTGQPWFISLCNGNLGNSEVEAVISEILASDFSLILEGCMWNELGPSSTSTAHNAAHPVGAFVRRLKVYDTSVMVRVSQLVQELYCDAPPEWPHKRAVIFSLHQAHEHRDAVGLAGLNPCRFHPETHFVSSGVREEARTVPAFVCSLVLLKPLHFEHSYWLLRMEYLLNFI